MDIKKILELHAAWTYDIQAGKRADLIRANLSGADLSGADLSGANLSGADLSGANLSGANLREADLIRANLSGADLSGADLSGANLRGANLIRANLSGADLSGANLSGADLPRVLQVDNFKPAILSNINAEGCALKMATWHSPTCDTVHCLAGWAVTLHPEGALLESMIGTNAAGALIFNACCGEVPDFYASDEAAMEWLKK